MRHPGFGATGPFDADHRQFVSDDTVIGIFQSRDTPVGDGTDQPTPRPIIEDHFIAIRILT
jgi:hypothetical protein